jgi:hypothetical protein
LIDRVRASGVELQAAPGQHLRVLLHGKQLDPALVESLRQMKLAVLNQLEAERKANLAVERRGRDEEALASEWRVDHDMFVVAQTAQACGRQAACLACGGTWELHGRPPRARWHIVSDPETVTLIAARVSIGSSKWSSRTMPMLTFTPSRG